MASSASLSLFPSVQPQQPRKSSLKPPKNNDASAAPGELQGVAVQISSTAASSKLFLKPADDQVMHSLFCEPSSTTQTTTSRTLPKRQKPARRRSADVSSLHTASPLIEMTTPTSAQGSTPASAHSDAWPIRKDSHQFERQMKPANLDLAPKPDIEMPISPGGDALSPLPDKLAFSTTSPNFTEFSKSKLARFGSPSLSRSNSTSTVPPYSPPPTRSIFPQYDPTRPLQEQEYYPTARSPTPTLPHEQVSKLSPPIEQVQTLTRLDSGVALLEGYKNIPVAKVGDMQAIWNASCGIFPVLGRKVKLGLFQPRIKGTTLAIGNSDGELLYSMEKDTAARATKDSPPFKQLVISRHNPMKQGAPPATVALLGLPDTAKVDRPRDNDVVTIFPQIAAVKAIETIANSPVAADIATFDPQAKSPEAARLAQDAVAEAHRRYRCELVRTTRKRDSLGAITASYKLEHPLLESFTITVTKSTTGRHARDPRAKISIHHPSATPAAVAAETLVLAWLDFACDACVLDTPALLALESEYIIDTIICALLSVAIIENDALMLETLTFDAPPKSPLNLVGRKSRRFSTASRGMSRKDKRKRKNGEFVESEQVELPAVTQGALALLGFSFKTAVFLLETGVKITAGVVIGVSHVASKANK